MHIDKSLFSSYTATASDTSPTAAHKPLVWAFIAIGGVRFTIESSKAHTGEISACFADCFIGREMKATDYQAICELTAAPFRYAPTKCL